MSRISYKTYVAGWMNASVRDFVKRLPSNASTQYALITCLDSDINPRALFEQGKLPVLEDAVIVGDGILVPTEVLLHSPGNELLHGFDELWFFPSQLVTPKPSGVWIVGPSRIKRKKVHALGDWMLETSCSLAIGDGEGLNYIIKAKGLARHIISSSNQTFSGVIVKEY